MPGVNGQLSPSSASASGLEVAHRSCCCCLRLTPQIEDPSIARTAAVAATCCCAELLALLLDTDPAMGVPTKPVCTPVARTEGARVPRRAKPSLILLLTTSIQGHK